MSLLTPPSTSHRAEKENRPPVAGPSTRKVLWAAKEIVFCLDTPPSTDPVISKERGRTGRSILKKRQYLEVPCTGSDVQNQRETTPEPSDPVVDLTYLAHPVETIIDENASLLDLVRSYNILAVRLRAAVNETTNADASWPLFQPFRKNLQAFTDAVIRDLNRAFVDPLSLEAGEGTKTSLPSPKSSPTKKKGGMTGEQAKYGRDLYTTVHSVLKFLGLIFSLPAVFNVFREEQLRDILTAILRIPLADELPTPNARKTWSIAIMVLQVQRLPPSILKRAAPRIARAIDRGISGDLGKEGKRGAVHDGLKAIHDMCAHQPEIFIHAFTPLLPSLLSNLLAPTLTLRAMACHALGGFVIASLEIKVGPLHTQIANHVTNFLTTVDDASARSSSPTKSSDPSIVRTLRTVMAATEAPQVAQGPVWGLIVISSFIVLLGARLSENSKVGRTISTLLGLGMRSSKSSIRALTCIVWRTVTWAYIQAPLPPIKDDDGEEEVDDVPSQSSSARDSLGKTMMALVDYQAGVSTIGALLGDNVYFSQHQDEAHDITIALLQTMIRKSNTTRIDALQTMRKLLTPDDTQEPWDPSLLLPRKLFSSMPGLLTVDFKNLSQVVRPVFEQVGMLEDIRPLTKDELANEDVFEGLLETWKIALGYLQLNDMSPVDENISDTWGLLLRHQAVILEDNHGERARAALVKHAVDYIITILDEPNFDFSARDPDLGLDTGGVEVTCHGPTRCSKGELRMRVAACLWAEMRCAFRERGLEAASEALLESFIRNEKALVFEAPEEDEREPEEKEEDITRARRSWVEFCAQIAMSNCTADTELLKAFWGYEDPDLKDWTMEHANDIWRDFVDVWIRYRGSWEGMVILLAVPFTDRYIWDISQEDMVLWEGSLNYAISAAADFGVDNYVVLTGLSSFISIFQKPSAHTLRSLEFMLGHLEEDMKDIPQAFSELLSDTMVASYPPEPQHKTHAQWMARQLARTIEHCPLSLVLQFVDSFRDGLCVWFKDEERAWTEDDYVYDIVPVYEYITVRAQALPRTVENLQILAPILAAPFTSSRSQPNSGFINALTEYWKTFKTSETEEWPEEFTAALEFIGVIPKRTPATPNRAAFIPLPRTPPTKHRRAVLAQMPTPQRPQKSISALPIVPVTPESPVNRRASMARRPATPSSVLRPFDSSPKRRRFSEGEDEKENLRFFDSEPITSVTQRLVEAVAGKKRSFEELQEAHKAAPKPSSLAPVSTPLPVSKAKSRMRPRSSKKPKSSTSSRAATTPSPPGGTDTEDERAVAEALVPFPSSDDNDVTPTMSGKRARCESNVSVHEGVVTPTAIRKIDVTNKALLRRTASAPVVNGLVSKKRKRSPDTDDACETSSPTTTPKASAPSRPLKRAYTLPSSDADGHLKPSTSSDPPSSDDDPHLGQVTPHHLISPIVQRRGTAFKECLLRSVQLTPLSRPKTPFANTTPVPRLSLTQGLVGEDDAEMDPPGSDDSTSSNSDAELDSSPTRAIASRQRQRVESMSF